MIVNEGKYVEMDSENAQNTLYENKYICMTSNMSDCQLLTYGPLLKLATRLLEFPFKFCLNMDL